MLQHNTTKYNTTQYDIQQYSIIQNIQEFTQRYNCLVIKKKLFYN